MALAVGALPPLPAACGGKCPHCPPPPPPGSYAYENYCIVNKLYDTLNAMPLLHCSSTHAQRQISRYLSQSIRPLLGLLLLVWVVSVVQVSATD